MKSIYIIKAYYLNSNEFNFTYARLGTFHGLFFQIFSISI